MNIRKVEFRGWHAELPKRANRATPLSEHDLLRIVILAESDEKRRWVEFQCEDRLHAIKVANTINTFGFDIEVTAREDRVFARATR